MNGELCLGNAIAMKSASRRRLSPPVAYPLDLRSDGGIQDQERGALVQNRIVLGAAGALDAARAAAIFAAAAALDELQRLLK